MHKVCYAPAPASLLTPHIFFAANNQPSLLSNKMAPVANDDGSISSGSSTRLNDEGRGSSSNLLAYSPLNTGISRRYSLRPTPERERRNNDPVGMVVGPTQRRSSADQLQQIQQLQAQQDQLLAEFEAARALVDRCQPPAPQQPVAQE